MKKLLTVLSLSSLFSLSACTISDETTGETTEEVTSTSEPVSSAPKQITFTTEQVANGQAIYTSNCQVCHGSNLDNGQFAGPIKGFFFQRAWGEKTVGEFARYVWEEMPKGAGKSLRQEEYIDTVAFILSNNGFEASDTPLSTSFEDLDNLSIAL